MSPAIISFLMVFLEKAITRAVDDKSQARRISGHLQKLLTDEPEHLDRLWSEINIQQTEVNKLEAVSHRIFIAGWRPMAGWSCALGVFWMFVGEPLVTSLLLAFGIEFIVPKLPEDRLFELLFALLGMAGIRSFDKLKGVSR